MGREIRRVPANWEHPKDGQSGEYIPLLDGYAEDFAKFEKNIKEMGLAEAIEYHGGGPQRDNYVQYNGRPAEWYQVYETVSEGTPVSPPFATEQEVVDYLVEHGDFWAQHRGDGGMERAAAEQFVCDGWQPSLVVYNK